MSSSADRHHRRRQEMVKTQIEKRHVHHPAVVSAMRKVPRHLFVPPELLERAYEDRPLHIGHEQTISQPYMVAHMTALLDPKPTDRILEIGTGSGYQAAVLAECVKEVFSVEYLSELSKQAQQTLQSLSYYHIHLKVGNGALGWPEHAPFDGIIVTAAAKQVPTPLIDQLAPGGRIVIPIEESTENQFIHIVQKKEDGTISETKGMEVRFVPFIT